MATSSSSGVLALFPPRNKLLCWFEAYSYVFTAQTTAASFPYLRARARVLSRSRAFRREKSTVERGGRGSKQGTQRRQRSREKKSAVERGARGIKRGTLHCGDDVQRRQRSKEKSDVEGAGREIGLGVLLYASKTAYCSALFQACKLIT